MPIDQRQPARKEPGLGGEGGGHGVEREQERERLPGAGGEPHPSKEPIVRRKAQAGEREHPVK